MPTKGVTRTPTQNEPPHLSLNRPGPAVDRPHNRVGVAESTETELKYFILPELAKEVTRNREYLRIEQHYFPRRAIHGLIDSFGVHNLVESAEAFSTARIRRVTHPSGDVTHLLEFKGAKEDVLGSRISRREFGIEIPERVFLALKGDATAGSLIKRRYHIQGRTTGGTNYPLVLQVDILEEVGHPLRKLSKEFCTADIEVRDLRLIKTIRAGHHTLPFLSECVELSATNHILSNRRLAKRGFDEEQRNALSKITASALQGMSA